MAATCYPHTPMTATDPSWWDSFSNQPYRIPAAEKPRGGWPNVREYLAIAATALARAPALAWRYQALEPRPSQRDAASFVGLSVTPDPAYDTAVEEMVDELGVQELLVRVPTWEIERIDQYARFLERLPGRRFLINVLQSRDSVRHPERWREQLRVIFSTLEDRVSHFQIGNAINRTKWGCAHPGEYLRLLEIAEAVRREFTGVRLVGSSVIDFEPLITLRTLCNRRRYELDVVAALLYVNRRGSPFRRQYGVFDLHNKLRLIYAMVSLGTRNARRLWITETNWPLLHTQPYTPNSGHPRSTVDEATQARYLKQYYQIAHQSGWVEKVYWWQLINPGYGLVDHRGGALRKHPAYHALKEIMHGDLYRPPSADPRPAQR